MMLLSGCHDLVGVLSPAQADAPDPVAEQPETTPAGSAAADEEAAGDAAPAQDEAPAAPAAAADGAPLVIEAESMTGIGNAFVARDDASASGGAYAHYSCDAPGRTGTLDDAARAGRLHATVEITAPGVYEYRQRMRQDLSGGLERDKANDVFVFSPDAAQVRGSKGTQYTEPVKVFGPNGPAFGRFGGQADHQHKKEQLQLVFDTAGTYTVEVYPRSCPFHLDAIQLLPS
jgi:hypothetical protein